MNKIKHLISLQKGSISLSLIGLGVLVVSAVVLPAATMLAGRRTVTQQKAAGQCWMCQTSCYANSTCTVPAYQGGGCDGQSQYLAGRLGSSDSDCYQDGSMYKKSTCTYGTYDSCPAPPSESCTVIAADSTEWTISRNNKRCVTVGNFSVYYHCINPPTAQSLGGCASSLCNDETGCSSPPTGTLNLSVNYGCGKYDEGLVSSVEYYIDGELKKTNNCPSDSSAGPNQASITVTKASHNFRIKVVGAGAECSGATGDFGAASSVSGECQVNLHPKTSSPPEVTRVGCNEDCENPIDCRESWQTCHTVSTNPLVKKCRSYNCPENTGCPSDCSPPALAGSIGALTLSVNYGCGQYNEGTATAVEYYLNGALKGRNVCASDTAAGPNQATINVAKGNYNFEIKVVGTGKSCTGTANLTSDYLAKSCSVSLTPRTEAAAAPPRIECDWCTNEGQCPTDSGWVWRPSSYCGVPGDGCCSRPSGGGAPAGTGTAFNGIIVSPDNRRWMPGDNNCSDHKGVTVSSTNGRLEWIPDSSGGHFDFTGATPGQTTVTYTPPADCSLKCGWWVVKENGNVVANGNGCSATFDVVEGMWKTGVEFRLVQGTGTNTPATPTITPPVCSINDNPTLTAEGKLSVTYRYEGRNTDSRLKLGSSCFYREIGDSNWTVFSEDNAIANAAPGSKGSRTCEITGLDSSKTYEVAPGVTVYFDSNGNGQYDATDLHQSCTGRGGASGSCGACYRTVALAGLTEQGERVVGRVIKDGQPQSRGNFLIISNDGRSCASNNCWATNEGGAYYSIGRWPAGAQTSITLSGVPSGYTCGWSFIGINADNSREGQASGTGCTTDEFTIQEGTNSPHWQNHLTFTLVQAPSDDSCSCPEGKPAKSLGNADCDDDIDLVDFDIWRRELLGELTTKTANFNCAGEGADNVVDMIDFDIWRQNFLQQ